MKMKDYINDFTNHLREAIEIGEASKLKKLDKTFNSILICGLGGSGIGGTIVSGQGTANCTIAFNEVGSQDVTCTVTSADPDISGPTSGSDTITVTVS